MHPPATRVIYRDQPYLLELNADGSVAAVAILKQGDYLIASVQSALTDTEVIELRDALLDQVAMHRSRGVILDVAALDIIDSFAARSFSTVARTNRLRGAKTVIVGIQPEVAVAMSQFGLRLDAAHIALDLEAGIQLLTA